MPVGVDASFAQYIGMALARVPDPWARGAGPDADHWMRPLTDALHELGIEMRDVRQSEHYPAGAYNAEIRRAMDACALIFDVLAVQQTSSRHDKPVFDGERTSGKLVWKVDWPMRWAYEGVAFEPAGEDHHAPTGSFTVGSTLVREVFGGEPPLSAVYSFVSLAGMGGKLSGSAGGAPIPATARARAGDRALAIRRLPSQGFAIDLSATGVQ